MNIKINDFTFNTVDYREKMNQIESAYREKGGEFEKNILQPLLGEKGFKEFEELKETMLFVFDNAKPCLAPWKTRNLKERKVKVLINIDKKEVLYIPVYLLAKCSLRRATDQDFY